MHIKNKGNNFKYFNDKAKSISNTVAQPAPNINNRILKNSTLKYLCNFWKSLEMLLISCKVELKFKRTKYCVLAAVGNDNIDTIPDNITFTIKDTRLYVPVVTLSAKNNQKLSTCLSKGFERSV